MEGQKMFGKFVVNSGHQHGNDDESTTHGEFEEKSYFCLKRTFFVRKWFIHLVHWPWFERVSMFVILLNCACLALADPLDRACSQLRCQRLKKVNVFVLWFFVAEMIIKMTAMGIVGRRGYLSEGWNRLDFLIVVAGIADEFSSLDGAFLVTIRLVRVLRPLRAINRVPSIRILVTLLLEALPLLGNVFALAFLVLFIFGIVGVQLWQGVLRNRCFFNSTLAINDSFTNFFYRLSFDVPDFLCSLPSDAGTKYCSDIPALQSTCTSVDCHGISYISERFCNDNSTSVNFNNSFRCSQDGPNPFFRTVSFDNIGYAWMAIFQIITLEGWTDLMYLIQEAHGYWNWIYFVVLILIGPFFLVNLCLVVLAMQFQETKSRELQLLEEDRQKKIEAQKIFKETKWGKVISIMKTNISESLQKRADDQHVHHHHHIHHYYHHEHVLQNPTSDPSVTTATDPRDSPGLPAVVLSHENSSTVPPPAFHIQHEPSDSIIALELTSNCKISQNFLSPTTPFSGRVSPTWSVRSSSLKRFSFSPEAISRSWSCENLSSKAPVGCLTSATVTINVTTPNASIRRSKDIHNITTAEVTASAVANASITTEKVYGNTQGCESEEEIPKNTLSIRRSNDVLNITTAEVAASAAANASITTEKVYCNTQISKSNVEEIPENTLSRRRSKDVINVTIADVAASAAANASITTEKVYGNTQISKSNGEEIPENTLSKRRSKDVINVTIADVAASVAANASITTAQVYNDAQDCRSQGEGSPKNNAFNRTKSLPTNNSLKTLVANASITTEQDYNDTQGRKSQEDESPKNRTLNLSPNHARTKPRSTNNSLKTLDISEFTVNASPKVSKRADREVLSRQSSSAYVSAAKTQDNQSTMAMKRREKQGLDDRFGSMFDIQRSAQYYVSQERTSFEKVREICARVAKSSSFINFTMAVIVVNTITMATEHYEQPEALTDFLEISNLVFISIFTLEMSIKIFGEGFRVYLSQWFNIFDGFIVIISIIEVIILRGGSGGLSVLRSIRLLRIFRLIRPIRHQLIVMVHTMASVVTFTALLFLFMFTFAVLGMNLFGGKMSLPTRDCREENVRSNFDTFPSAMITVFQILTLEDWNLVMQNAMRSTTHWAAVYFITLTIFGYYVLFNLLVAILVEGFTNPMLLDPNESDEKQDIEHNGAEEAKSTTDWLSLVRLAKEQPSTSHSSPDNNEDDFEDLANLETETSDIKYTPKTFHSPINYCGPAMRGVIAKPNQLQNIFGKPDNSYDITQSVTKDKALPSVEITQSHDPKTVTKANKLIPRNVNSRLNHFWSRNNNGFYDEGARKFCEISKPRIVITSEDESAGNKVKDDSLAVTTPCDQQKTVNPDDSKSLFIFSENNKFRQLMIKISTSKWFDNFILFLILVSCVFMVLDQHQSNATEHQNDLAYTVSFVFTIVFTVEVVIKVIAQGLVMGKTAYLRVGWNNLDFIIVLVSWLHVITISSSSTSPGILGSVKVLRALRTLRPLRMIRRAPGLKLVVGALLHSLKPIGNTVLIAGIFFVVFGVLGVQLFKGALFHCDGNPDVITRQECSDSGQGKWVNRQYNFDNLAQALVTLFVLATRDGWVTLMHHGVDSVGIHLQPKLNHNEWKVCYFISFLMVVGFLVLNMMVGIVVNNYQLCQKKQEKKDKKVKRQPVDALEIVDKTNYESPAVLRSSPFRRRCFRLCNNKYWDLAIAFVICVNVILMSVEHYNMSKNCKLLLEVNNYVCTGIFIMEACVKLSAFGCRGYFQDKWNILDFLVVIFSVADIIMDSLHHAIHLSVKPTVVRGLRVLRIIRVLKLFKVAKGVRSLLDTVTKSLPQVANLGILLFLLFFIYSSLGIQLFGSLECSGQYSCNGLDDHANFRDFQTAMLTLFRVSTGDNWNTLFKDTLRSDCDSSISCEKNCCFSKYVAPVYFTTFVLATHFVLLNVLVAVLMKDLKASREKLAKVLTHETLDKRVLKLTLSATKFVKNKAFPKKPSESKEHIELRKVRTTLAVPRQEIA